jgi:acetolactate synthase-1/2/3 large subunit
MTSFAQNPAQLLLGYIKTEQRAEKKHVFGVPGAAFMQILYEMRIDPQIEYVITKHETGAAYMAHGYYLSTGDLGVVMVTSGPGATNALTGAMNANNALASVLTLTGEVSEQYLGRGYLQEGVDLNLDVVNSFKSATSYSVLVTNIANAQILYEEALRHACSAPAKAVHISLPNDIGATNYPTPVPVPQTTQAYRSQGCSSNYSDAKKTLELMLDSDKPLLFLGNGTRIALSDANRLRAFEDFCEKFAFPVMTTPDAKSVFSDNNALSLRNFGTSYCKWTEYYMKQGYDTLVTIGSKMGGMATYNWNPMLKPSKNFVQVDLNPNVIGRQMPLTFGVVAEAASFLDNLIAAAKDVQPDENRISKRRAFIAQIKSQTPFAEPEKTNLVGESPIYPQAMMQVFSNVMNGRDAHILCDNGNSFGWLLGYFHAEPPTKVHLCLNMGPMGFAVAGVVGTKIGNPKLPAIALAGDGAFLMHGTEISTAAQYNVGAIWIVLSDDDLSMVSQGMNHFFPDKFHQKQDIWDDYYKLGNPNLKEFAVSMGADAYDVFNSVDFGKILERCILEADEKQKPQVIIAHINSKQMPPFYQ